MKIKKNNPIVIFLVVGGLLIFLHGVGALRPLENLLSSLTRPLAERLYRHGALFNRSYTAAQKKEDLTARVEELTKEATQLIVANSRCREIEDENQKLRATLKFLSTNDFKAVVASVIAKEAGGEDSRGLIINRGTRDGVNVGLGVVSEEGVIVGQVVETKDTTARICLTINSNCQLAAALQNQTKTQGLTDGDLGLTIKMNYIPQLEKVTVGDTVITSGLGGSIPRGLVIGRVTQVYSASNEVWQGATIEPLINLNNLTVVSVIIP
jgi:rod shape-determining protein MreC